jgi:hypothetical protein
MEEEMEDIHIQKVRKDCYLLTVNRLCDVIVHNTNGCCICVVPVANVFWMMFQEGRSSKL